MWCLQRRREFYSKCHCIACTEALIRGRGNSKGRTEHCWYWSNLGSRVVLVEILHSPVLRWCSKAVQIIHIAHGLEIATTNEEVDWLSSSLANILDGCIYRIKLTMAAAIDSHLHATDSY